MRIGNNSVGTSTMRYRYHEYLFPAYFIGLLLSTYLGFGAYYIVGTFILGIFLSYTVMRTVQIRVLKSFWVLFLAYYLLISLVGMTMGYVGAKNLLEFICKFILLPFSVVRTLPERKKIPQMIHVLKIAILVAALFGFVEYAMKYNPMVNVVRLSNRVWMEMMNGRSNYRPSSLFLHYNYYGCVLVMGIVINKYFPFRSTLKNTAFLLLTLSQLLLCQSRICWIAAASVAIIWLFTSKVIVNKAGKGTAMLLLFLIIILAFDPAIVLTVGNMISGRFENLFIYGLEEGSLGQRLGTLMNWPKYFSGNTIQGIFGTGFQSVDVYFMRHYSFFTGYSTADSELTVYLVETGIVGVTILLAAICQFMYSQIQIEDPLAKLCCVGLIAWLIESLTLDLASNNILLCLIVLLIVIGTGARGLKERQKIE